MRGALRAHALCGVTGRRGAPAPDEGAYTSVAGVAACATKKSFASRRRAESEPYRAWIAAWTDADDDDDDAMARGARSTPRALGDTAGRSGRATTRAVGGGRRAAGRGAGGHERAPRDA